MNEDREQQRKIQNAAIMARVSLEKQAKEGYSLPAQIELGGMIASKYGLAIDNRYILQDAGYSGDDWDRPAINRALALIRTGKVQALVFTNSDRFSRDVEGGLRIIREIRAAGARIIFGDLGEYSDDATFRMMLTIKMAVAEAEKANIKARSRTGTLQKVRQGVAFGRMLYGFKIENGKIVPVPEQVAVLEQIFNWADQGWSQRRIIRELKARNIAPPHKNWNNFTIAAILRDPFYATGEWYYNKRRAVAPKKLRKPEGERHRKTTTQVMRPREEWIPLGGEKVQPVISAAQFARVGAMLSRNIHGLGGRPSDRYLLKSLVWCGKCGKRCCGRINHGKFTWYICTHRDRVTGEQLCDAETVSGPALEQCAWDAAMSVLGDERTLRAAVEEHLEQQKTTANAGEVARLQARIEELRRIEFKARGAELKATEVETAAFYKAQYQEAMQERRFHEAELITLIGKGAAGKVDAAAVARAVQAERHCDLADKNTRCDIQELLQEWIDRVEYLDGEAEITLRVPLAAAKAMVENCQRQLPNASSFILLKIKRRVA
jgi:site-specific DNA recombinase